MVDGNVVMHALTIPEIVGRLCSILEVALPRPVSPQWFALTDIQGFSMVKVLIPPTFTR